MERLRSRIRQTLSSRISLMVACDNRLDRGMPIKSFSRILRHTNITTTQIYVKMTSQMLINEPVI